MLLLTHAETQIGQYINETKVQVQNSSLPSSVSMWPMRSRCPNEFPRDSDTLAEKGLGRRRTGTRQDSSARDVF